MMAQAIRRVWGTFTIPSRRAISIVTWDCVLTSSSRIAATRSIPCSRASAAVSTALWGTDTSLMRSASSLTEPLSQPDSGNRLSDGSA